MRVGVHRQHPGMAVDNLENTFGERLRQEPFSIVRDNDRVDIGREDFVRILQIARPGETGETYAFDSKGLLLSESRFTKDLIRLGLVTEQAAARSQLADVLKRGDLLVANDAATLPASLTGMHPRKTSGADIAAGISVEDGKGFRIRCDSYH